QAATPAPSQEQPSATLSVASDGTRDPDDTETPEQSGAQSAPRQPEGPPKTVEELAKRATTDTRESLEEATDAVGRVARKTWGCLASLFSDC
ncbi:MAG: hypothetical protein AAGG72_04515, partial [Pseudomonadota bacterium]